MKDALQEPRKEQHNQAICTGRREFLVRAGTTAGGLLLGLSLPGAPATGEVKADEQPVPSEAGAGGKEPDDLVLKLSEHGSLRQVGGSETVETTTGKVIVARIEEFSFAACSAICPHKGGPIKYDAEQKQFYCPLHNSRFDLNGKVTKGPARTDLKSYPSQTAAVVSLQGRN